MTFIGQCNIRSLNTSATFVENLCQKKDLGILALSEIWHPDYEKTNLLNSWIWYKSERKHREGGGAAIIVRPDVKSSPKEDLKCNGLEAAWCYLHFGGEKILFCSVYIPPKNEQAMKLLTATKSSQR